MTVLLALLGRLLLVAALLAPHGARAEPGGLTLVICGAEGAYEIVLPGGPPSPHADRHDCCLGVCAAFGAPTAYPLAPTVLGFASAPPPLTDVAFVAAAVLPPPARGPPAPI